MAELEESSTKSEDEALITWPLIVATGLSELKVCPPRTTASGESDARDALTVKSPAISVEYSVGVACTTDGSVYAAEVSSPDVACVDAPVGSVVVAGS